MRHDVEMDRADGNLRTLSLDLVGLGDAAAARPLLTEAVEISRQIGDMGGEAR